MTNTSHYKQETFLYEYPLHRVLLPAKTHSRALLFSDTPLKHGCHFDHWNQPLNICMCICYLDCLEAGLCCYLLMHIKKTYYIHHSCFTSISDLFTDVTDSLIHCNLNESVFGYEEFSLLGCNSV
jgi:hypothetical protein